MLPVLRGAMAAAGLVAGGVTLALRRSEVSSEQIRVLTKAAEVLTKCVRPALA